MRNRDNDRDSDGINDLWETKFWGQTALTQATIDKEGYNVDDYYYWQNLHYDGNAFQNDDEFNADMEGGRKWVKGSLDAHDWSLPGKQSKKPY